MTHFFTNQDNNSLKNRFNQLLHLNLEQIKIIVGYLRISGFTQITKDIEKVDKIKILVGLNVDEKSYKLINTKLNFEIIQKAKSKFIDEQIKIIQDEKYNKTIEDNINLFEKLVNENKLEIRIYKDKNLHAKMYIFIEKTNGIKINNEIDYRGGVITGSSNFSSSGFENNYEINVELRDGNDIKDANNIFEDLWQKGIEITTTDIEAVKSKTYLQTITPHQLYIKLLIEYFRERIYINDDDEWEFEKIKKLSYQKDAVLQGYHLLEKHNGFFLADVVGLGKTIIAYLIIQKYIKNNPKERVLIITPPSLQYNWELTGEKFENIKIYCTIQSSYQLSKIKNPERYSLIVIDESHQFRNKTTNRYAEVEKICKTLTKSGKRKKVILISATPLNNNPTDIENQLYLFQDSRASTIQKHLNLQSYFSDLQYNFDKIKKNKDLSQKKSELKLLLKDLRENIFKEIMVRRTRSNLKNIESYKKDLKAQKIDFPDIKDVVELKYKLNAEVSKLFTESVNVITKKLGYYKYLAYQFLKDDVKQQLATEKNIEKNFYDMFSKQLAKLMQTLLVKRLESSFHAFKESLNSFAEKLVDLIKQFEKNVIILSEDFRKEFDNIELEIIDENEELLKLYEQKKVFKIDDFEADYIDKLHDDLETINHLTEQWKNIDFDPKIDYLNEKIDDLIKINKKIVIFTESTKTGNYLKEKLKKDKILFINSSNRKELNINIIENFDENSEIQKDDYNILITTDTLAEGVNLHRSNIIVNYDIPWNSTKIMQRIGRVNRIGSKYKEIFVYNFIPTSEANDLIKLVETAYQKIQAFHYALGNDNKVLINEEEVEVYKIFNENDLTEDEENEQELQLLEDIKMFKEKHFEEFEKIKKLPSKIRVMRKHKEENQINTTFMYLKNDNYEKFYKINNKEQIEELNFVNFAQNLYADFNEKSLQNIDDIHYIHTKNAFDKFENELKSVNEKFEHGLMKVTNRIDKKAIDNIEKFQKIYFDDFLNEFTQMISMGVHFELSKKINDIFKNNDNNNIFNQLKALKDSYKFSKPDLIDIDIDTILSETIL